MDWEIATALFLFLLIAAFHFWKHVLNAPARVDERALFVKGFYQSLTRIHALIYKHIPPESEEEKMICQYIPRDEKGNLVLNKEGKLRLLELHNYLWQLFKLQCDQYGQYYETRCGSMVRREYPLLQNILPALQHEGMFQVAVIGEHHEDFDCSYIIGNAKDAILEKPKTLQPKRTEPAKVTKRKNELLNNRPPVKMGQQIEFAA